MCKQHFVLVCKCEVRGVVRLYEGDPAPTSPFAELLNIENGEPIGKGGMKRLVPWEGSKSSGSADYMVVITDPRPKSIELRTAMKRLAGAFGSDVLKKCVIINTDTPAENRRFMKKNFGEEIEQQSGFRILCDENMEWMREYTALGEKVRVWSICNLLSHNWFVRSLKSPCIIYMPNMNIAIFNDNVCP